MVEADKLLITSCYLGVSLYSNVHFESIKLGMKLIQQKGRQIRLIKGIIVKF